MIKSKVIKAPIDILNQLEKEYPNISYPARLRIIYNNHVQLKELQNKIISPAGKFIWGKRAWEKRFEKIQ